MRRREKAVREGDSEKESERERKLEVIGLPWQQEKKITKKGEKTRNGLYERELDSSLFS